MKRHLTLTAALAAITILLFGATNTYALTSQEAASKAKIYSKAVKTAEFFSAVAKCPDGKCPDQVSLNAANRLKRDAADNCFTAYGAEKGAKAADCKSAVEGIKLALADNVKPEKSGGGGGSWTNPCKPSPCGEGNQCKPTKNAEKKWVADCYCEGRSMKYGEKCENTFAPPQYKCEVIVDVTGRIEKLPSDNPCTSQEGWAQAYQPGGQCTDCQPLPESIGCHLRFWIITFLIVLAIIGGLIYTTIRFRKKWRQAELAVDRTKTMWREALGMANTRLSERGGEQVPEPVLQPPQSAKKK